MSLWPQPPAWMSSPLALAYGGAVCLRRALYDRGALRQAGSHLPTISVGGLEAGGSGKTPVTAWWLAELLAAGRRPGLLTRGYGRASRGLVLRLPTESADPAILGDEPAMLLQSGLDVAVASCASRRRGAAALEAAGCDVLVLDDGFAHRALRRDLDVVVLRAEAPLGNGHLLPWGTLREPASSLGRAQVVWLHAKNPRTAMMPPPAALTALAPQALFVQSRAQPVPPVDAAGRLVQLQDAAVWVAAGIAWPKQFCKCVKAAGARVMGLIRYRDHHVFTKADVAYLRGCLQQSGATAVVVTPKDAIKLAKIWPEATSLWILGTRVQLEYGKAALLTRLKNVLRPDVIC